MSGAVAATARRQAAASNPRGLAERLGPTCGDDPAAKASNPPPGRDLAASLALLDSAGLILLD